MSMNDQLIKQELQKFVDNLNFIDVIQFFTSKLFSKLLATEPTQEQTDTLQKWKQSSKVSNNSGSGYTEEDDSFNVLDFEIFSSNQDTIFIISKGD
jgi:hypothetical protein